MPYASPYGHEFRAIMDAWDRRLVREQIENLKAKIGAILDRVGMVIRHNGKLYACDEGQRIRFSVLRKPKAGPGDEADPPRKDDTFGAIDLAAWLRDPGGEVPETAIDRKGAKKCQVVSDRDEVIRDLLAELDAGDGATARVPADKPVLTDRRR